MLPGVEIGLRNARRSAGDNLDTLHPELRHEAARRIVALVEDRHNYGSVSYTGPTDGYGHVTRTIRFEIEGDGAWEYKSRYLREREVERLIEAAE